MALSGGGAVKALNAKGAGDWSRSRIDAMNQLVAYLTENCCKSSPACVPVCTPKRRPGAARRIL